MEKDMTGIFLSLAELEHQDDIELVKMQGVGIIILSL